MERAAVAHPAAVIVVDHADPGGGERDEADAAAEQTAEDRIQAGFDDLSARLEGVERALSRLEKP